MQKPLRFFPQPPPRSDVDVQLANSVQSIGAIRFRSRFVSDSGPVVGNYDWLRERRVPAFPSMARSIQAPQERTLRQP
jgi:hypothetical protein